MSELCITCGERPRKSGRRQCGHCAWRSEDRDKARVRRREFKRRLRRAQGAEPIEAIRERAATQRAEAVAKRAEEQAATRKAKPWLRYPAGSAARFRCRYKHDPAFAQRERDRAIVFRFTNPDIAVKSDPGQHWQLAASRADGSVTRTVVRKLLRAKRCYICGVELTPGNRSIDHRVALILGGDHTAENLAPCCRPCNQKKGGFERKLAQNLQEDRVNSQVLLEFAFTYRKELISRCYSVPYGATQAGAGDLGPRSVGES